MIRVEMLHVSLGPENSSVERSGTCGHVGAGPTTGKVVGSLHLLSVKACGGRRKGRWISADAVQADWPLPGKLALPTNKLWRPLGRATFVVMLKSCPSSKKVRQ